MKLQGKIVLVTGGGRGIGKATARCFAREGAKVVICSRSGMELKETEKEIKNEGHDVLIHVADITSIREVQRLFKTIKSYYGYVDILINNASILGPKTEIISYPYQEWLKVIDVNLNGMFNVTQSALKQMVLKNGGCIINISSGVGRQGKPHWGAYAVSKFGVEGLTQVLAPEVSQYHIRVMSLNPGPTRTQMRAAACPDEDPQTVPPPEKIAETCLYLATSTDISDSGKSFDSRELFDKISR
ncbi:MAG: SDR family oxidoreductase [Nitrospirae bacterium]|nr:SDR family oxidoreductase [Nitrospirota bacterium]MBI3351883.1 SDR family oxidoreductase [Nitrospirota bacterium]